MAKRTNKKSKQPQRVARSKKGSRLQKRSGPKKQAARKFAGAKAGVPLAMETPFGLSGAEPSDSSPSSSSSSGESDFNFITSVDDATGPRYRKIALNGRPLPDEKPQHAAETDQEKEETYIDALTLGLRHSTTDIHIPLVGGELSLGARRDAHSEIWNLRSSLRPYERPDMPFGVCWSSNLTTNIHFVTQAGSGVLDPPYAHVTEENGAAHRFLVLNDLRSGGQTFFPLPNARTEQETYLATLTLNAQGKYEFRKKYGTTLVYELAQVGPVQGGFWVDLDRENPGAGYEYHRYARLVSVSDRYGTRILYTYSGPASLVPNEIIFFGKDGTDQRILITSTAVNVRNRRVTSIKDPSGNTYTFNYTDRKLFSTDVYTYYTLDSVLGPMNPENEKRPETLYSYTPAAPPEPDYDQAPPSGPTPQYHVDISAITDPMGHTYGFTYAYDLSKKRFSTYTGLYFSANGQPRNVTAVTLPNNLGTVTFENLSSVKLIGGGTEFSGYRVTRVNDAENNARVYHFEDTEVYFLNDFKTFLAPGAKTPKIVYYEKMTVLHFKGSNLTVNVSETEFSCVPHGDTQFIGQERYEYDVDAGLAVTKVVDLWGNETTYEHADTWDIYVKYPYLGLRQYVFGKYGDPTKQTNEKDDVKTFEYDPAWRVMTRVEDEEGRVTEYTIDGLGRRTAELIREESYGQIVQRTLFEYDDEGYPAFMTRRAVVKDVQNTAVIASGANPEGGGAGAYTPDEDPSWVTDFVAEYVSDGLGRVAQEIVDPPEDSGPSGLNLITSHEYDLNNNKTSTTDPRGNTTYFSYDKQNRLLEVQYPPTADSPGGAAKYFRYDLRGNKTKEIDENGHVTLFAYDALNRLVKQTRVMSENGAENPTLDLITLYEYNKVNAKTKVTDPEGHVTIMEYDALQRLVKTIAAPGVPGFGYETTYEYGMNSGSSAFDVSVFKPTKTTDPRGYTTEIDYDELFRPVEKRITYVKGTTPQIAITVMEYDKVGNLIRETDPLNRVTTRQYDTLNRLVLVTFPYNPQQEEPPTNEIYYTITGLKWKTIDELGRKTETEYDGAGRAIKVTGPPPDDDFPEVRPIIQTEYDENGNVIATINPLGNRWDYVFDARNRKTTEQQPAVVDGESESAEPVRPELHWQYSAVGTVVATTDARDNTTNSTYDAANRVIKVEAPAVAVPAGGTARPITLTDYDKNGNVIQVTDPNGNATTNTYDVLNRLITTTDAEGITVTNSYDEVGNRIAVEDGKGQTTLFGYDGLNRNTDVTDPADKATTFAYDAVNKVSRTDPLGQVTEYYYDLRNRLRIVGYNNRPQDSRTYSYDLVGNLLSVAEGGHSGKSDVAYTYDNLNRVVTETSGGVAHEYLYDLAGNRLQTEYGNGGRTMESTYDALNRLSTLTESGRSTAYKYDLNGNITAKNLPNCEIIEMTHDALNRVLKITAPGYTYDHAYDLVGNVIRIRETYPSNAALNRRIMNEYDAVNRLTTETIYSEAFSPVSIAGCKLWLRADGIAGLSDGAAVATWADESGNGNDATQDDSNRRPRFKTGIVNGMPVIRFDGSDDTMAIADTLDIAQPYTVFIVNAPVGVGILGRSLQSRTSGNNWLLGLWSNQSYSIHGFQPSDWVSGYPPTSGFQEVGVFHVDAGTGNDTESRYYRDGVDKTVDNSLLLDPGKLALNGGGAFPEYGNNDVAEVIVYDSVLSESDRQRVEEYLMDKYDITPISSEP